MRTERGFIQSSSFGSVIYINITYQLACCTPQGAFLYLRWKSTLLFSPTLHMVENVFPSEQPKVKPHCNTLFKERLPMHLESTQGKKGGIKKAGGRERMNANMGTLLSVPSSDPRSMTISLSCLIKISCQNRISTSFLTVRFVA